MNVQAALKTQYHAAMAMLKETMDRCPDGLWSDGADVVPFWRVVYHTLFFTHLYLQPDETSFAPWEHHRDKCHDLGKGAGAPEAGPPYTKPQLLEYWTLCDSSLDAWVDRMDLDAPACGFPWYQLPKLDHQINNIRHIQHHAALLSGRLRRAGQVSVRWVGKV